MLFRRKKTRRSGLVRWLLIYCQRYPFLPQFLSIEAKLPRITANSSGVPLDLFQSSIAADISARQLEGNPESAYFSSEFLSHPDMESKSKKAAVTRRHLHVFLTKSKAPCCFLRVIAHESYRCFWVIPKYKWPIVFMRTN